MLPAHPRLTVAARRLAGLTCAAVLAVLAGCATSGPPPDQPHTFVVLGPDGVAIARAITSAATCPAVTIDGSARAMRVRAAPATLAQRPTASAPQDSAPSRFPWLTCEATLPAGAGTASVAGLPLPLPAPTPTRIVVIGDTGCRMKKAEHAFQDCNDAAAYPFAAVAAAAAAWKPQLVIHVGDYHYRENRCPEGKPGCAGSPWGYGWDAWRADFFTPARSLLGAAPWVMVRGNHETCSRAGQGYWRFLDPRPLLAGRDCNAAADDHTGNFSAPYAVPLGADAQLLVIDTASTSWKGFRQGDLAIDKYRDDYRAIDALAQRAGHNIGLTHHPLLGFGAGQDASGKDVLYPGDAGLQQAYGALNPLLLPARIDAMLSGHVHLWQQVSFSSAHPSQFIAGFSGTAEETVPLPATLPAGASPAPGAIVAHFSSWGDGFGFMTMERQGSASWEVKIWDLAGQLKNTCQLKGSRSQCALAQVRATAQAGAR